MMTRHIRFLSS